MELELFQSQTVVDAYKSLVESQNKAVAWIRALLAEEPEGGNEMISRLLHGIAGHCHHAENEPFRTLAQAPIETLYDMSLWEKSLVIREGLLDLAVHTPASWHSLETVLKIYEHSLEEVRHQSKLDIKPTSWGKSLAEKFVTEVHEQGLDYFSELDGMNIPATRIKAMLDPWLKHDNPQVRDLARVLHTSLLR